MDSASNKTIVVIAGPTAVGKTSVAIDVAKAFGTEIISADSRQCYKELNIGVARPSDAQLQKVQHHFINSHSITQEVNAAVFEEYALNVLNDLFKNKNLVVVCGGTGLYIKALCEGFDQVPKIPGETKQFIDSHYKDYGIEWLQQQVSEKDPVFFIQGENKNPHRLMRALGVVMTTGKSILDFQKGVMAHREFRVIRIGLHVSKEILHRQIHQRVDAMIENGLVEEVKSLQTFRNYKALQTVGYTEIFNFIDGKISLHEAIELIKTNTRQYAKRQFTWFRKFGPYTWYDPVDPGNIISSIETALSH